MQAVFCSGTAWIQILARPLSTCVDLGKFPNLLCKCGQQPSPAIGNAEIGECHTWSIHGVAPSPAEHMTSVCWVD